MKFAHLLVTGGAGFIGSNFIRDTLAARPDVHITNLDALTYSGNLQSLEDVARLHAVDAGDGRYRLIEGDIRDASTLTALLRGQPWSAAGPIDGVVHFAAESHVDRSILGPLAFVDTNVMGTAALLDACRHSLEAQPRAFRFVHVSTDEVYGSLGVDDLAFTERTPLAPSSPYSASKAGSDLLVQSYVQTFGFPAVITRCSNNYGPFQFPEKLIPLMITRAMRDEPLPVYGDGLNVRDWIHVSDHCAAALRVLEDGACGTTYNLGGDAETSNLDIVHRVLEILGKPRSLIGYVTDRPGHDRRYAMNISRVATELGWKPKYNLTRGLETTVQWYVDNPQWWQPLLPESARVSEALYPTR